MKQLLSFKPVFTPGAAGVGTLDFTGYPGFNINRLYAVINLTQNAIIYAPGATNLGSTTVTNSITSPGGILLAAGIIALSFNTSTHSSTDQLNVFYDTSYNTQNTGAVGMEMNQTYETGGNLEKMMELQQAMLTELQTMNIILAQGLNINMDDLNQLRSDLTNPNTQEFRL
jgi:hypothetical protein